LYRQTGQTGREVNSGSLDLKSNLEAVAAAYRGSLPETGRPVSEVTLIAVTKTIAPRTSSQAVNWASAISVKTASRKLAENGGTAGFTDSPCRHLIGHLQSNKAKTALELFDIITALIA
jgi:uncharacterized pyridoxal phosphate-containing UPF0001 family protein